MTDDQDRATVSVFGGVMEPVLYADCRHHASYVTDWVRAPVEQADVDLRCPDCREADGG